MDDPVDADWVAEVAESVMLGWLHQYYATLPNQDERRFGLIEDPEYNVVEVKDIDGVFPPRRFSLSVQVEEIK